MLHLRPNTKTYSSKTPATGSTPGSTPNTNILKERLLVGHRQSPHFSNFSQLDTLSFPANFSLLDYLRICCYYTIFLSYISEFNIWNYAGRPNSFRLLFEFAFECGFTGGQHSGKTSTPASVGWPELTALFLVFLRRRRARRSWQLLFFFHLRVQHPRRSKAHNSPAVPNPQKNRSNDSPLLRFFQLISIDGCVA